MRAAICWPSPCGQDGGRKAERKGQVKTVKTATCHLNPADIVAVAVQPDEISFCRGFEVWTTGCNVSQQLCTTAI